MLGSLASIVRTLVLLAALGSLAAAAVPVARHLSGQSPALSELPTLAVAPADEPAPPDLGPILDLAPFGTVEVVPAPESPVGETTLDLVLQGVVLQEDPGASTAFIFHDGSTLGYRPGDPVTDRARLVEVAADQAVLEVDGKLQTLSFPDPAGEESAGPDSEFDTDPDADFDSELELDPDFDTDPELDPISDADVEADGGASSLSGPERLRQMVAAQTEEDTDGEDSPEEAEEPEPESLEAYEEHEPQTVQDQISMWQERIRANPQEVLDTIGLIPVENGYRIAEQHDSGVDLAGLQVGDVITSVNGQAVGDVDQDRQLFDEVVSSGHARIEVQRDGRTLVLTFPLQ